MKLSFETTQEFNFRIDAHVTHDRNNGEIEYEIEDVEFYFVFGKDCIKITEWEIQSKLYDIFIDEIIENYNNEKKCDFYNSPEEF